MVIGGPVQGYNITSTLLLQEEKTCKTEAISHFCKNQLTQTLQTSLIPPNKPETRPLCLSNSLVHRITVFLQNRATPAEPSPSPFSLVRFASNLFEYLPLNSPELSQASIASCNTINTHCHFCFKALQVEFCSTIQATSKQAKHWESFIGHQASSKEPQVPLEVAALSSSK